MTKRLTLGCASLVLAAAPFCLGASAQAAPHPVRPGDICGKIAEKHEFMASTLCTPLTGGLFYDQDALRICKTIADQATAKDDKILISMTFACMAKIKNTRFNKDQLRPCLEDVAKGDNKLAMYCMEPMGESAVREVVVPGSQATELPAGGKIADGSVKVEADSPAPAPLAKAEDKAATPAKEKQ